MDALTSSQQELVLTQIQSAVDGLQLDLNSDRTYSMRGGWVGQQSGRVGRWAERGSAVTLAAASGETLCGELADATLILEVPSSKGSSARLVFRRCD